MECEWAATERKIVAHDTIAEEENNASIMFGSMAPSKKKLSFRVLARRERRFKSEETNHC
ncbi:hypothetical protein COEREDRAFT_83744 [Coemansia reversa NRRL 1564]|uniref:Uncharacterized protein n=1 Tax=Coemansia reversa (strain ATCC 12441 / NRRL 1564) TaxID=763665 RepID=A0A2G5B238_COERN|nr:hypothetical protein COEREDRAFT_83744 [Coemansia reversa NRRL 1564]|eukprot:PIA13066.1 hypothetical protein COEREDRAFT_83744 [Coemansia reversa NRRL 1564]